MGGYRTSTNPQYEPGARTEVEPSLGTTFVLVQRHHDSPHLTVWVSEPYPSADAARRRALELRAMEAKKAGRNPVSVCSNLGALAFQYHWYLAKDDPSHPQGSLGECPVCYGEVEKLVRFAAEELEWIKEVHSG